MLYYFAPLEGITDYIYRRLHHQFFPGIDKYYTPFLSPTMHRSLTPREQKELPLYDGLHYRLVPQLLTKSPEDFLWMTQQCADRGYSEINLNLGCPSGTVTAKGKGSGMLRDMDALDHFLNRIYNEATIDISIKTRIGFKSPEEFPRLMELFNQYPIKELTIHPRVRESFYNGSVDTKTFDYAIKNSNIPLCYNGDIISLAQANSITGVGAVMIGRGLIADPGMLCHNGTDIAVLSVFYDTLLEAYIDAFGGAKNAISRLKEHWHYLLTHLKSTEKLTKQLRKTTDLTDYKQLTREIFSMQ